VEPLDHRIVFRRDIVARFGAEQLELGVDRATAGQRHGRIAVPLGHSV